MATQPSITGLSVAAAGPFSLEVAPPPQAISLTKSQIIDLWELGILNPTAFIALAILCEISAGDEDAKKAYSLHVEKFIHEWRGVMDPDSGKVKTLTRRQIFSAVALLSEKEFLVINNPVFQLHFSFD